MLHAVDLADKKGLFGTALESLCVLVVVRPAWLRSVVPTNEHMHSKVDH